jgi:hypothetical protein
VRGVLRTCHTPTPTPATAAMALTVAAITPRSMVLRLAPMTRKTLRRSGACATSSLTAKRQRLIGARSVAPAAKQILASSSVPPPRYRVRPYCKVTRPETIQRAQQERCMKALEPAPVGQSQIGCGAAGISEEVAGPDHTLVVPLIGRSGRPRRAERPDRSARADEDRGRPDCPERRLLREVQGEA